MTDARLSEAGSDRERALLRMGAQEVPSAESVRAAARVLGLVPRAAIVASVLGGLARTLKWSSPGAYILAPVVAAAGVVAGAYVVVERHSHAVVDEAASVAAAPRTLAPPTPPGLPVTVTALDAPLVPSRPPAADAQPVARRLTSSRAGARTGSPAVSDEVRAQVVLVDRARALLDSGNPGGALRMIDDYHRRFPRGVLSEEASFLRIQAAYARGDRAAGAALVQRFRADYPRSAYADRVRSMSSDGSN